MRIDATTLKGLMLDRGLNQVDLSRKTKLGTKTIGRALNGKELRTGNVELIAQALNVTVDHLVTPPSNPITDAVKTKPGLTRLVMDLDHTTMNKLQTAARRYQVEAKTIIKFAPLLFSMVAEASFAEREKQLQDWQEKMKTLVDNTPASPEMRAELEARIAEIAQREQACIDQFDLRSGFSSPRQQEAVGMFAAAGVTNPFLSFLKGLSGDQNFVIDSDSIDYLEYWHESLVDFGEADFRARTEIEELANVAVHEEWISLLDVPSELEQPHRGEDRTRWLASYYGDAKGDFQLAWRRWRESSDANHWLASSNMASVPTFRAPMPKDGTDEQTRP
jgi:hypothetical protein